MWLVSYCVGLYSCLLGRGSGLRGFQGGFDSNDGGGCQFMFVPLMCPACCDCQCQSVGCVYLLCNGVGD